MAWSWEKPLEHPLGCGGSAALARLAGTGRTCMSKGGGPQSQWQSHLWPSRCLSFPGLIWTGVPGAGTAAVPDVPEGHWLLRVGAVGVRALWGGWGLWVPGVGQGSVLAVGTWGQTRGGCAELAQAPALARGSKQATRDTRAQLCGGQLGSVGPALGGGNACPHRELRPRL